MKLSELFGLKKESENNEFGLLFASLQKILVGLGEDKLKLITGFAGLLGKTAYADMEISSSEQQRIRRVLNEVLHLEGSLVNSILELMLTHQAQLYSVEDHVYLRFINETCEKTQKLHLIEALFAVAAADETVSAEEDATIWNIAKSLHLSHKEFIQARIKYKEYLQVLKS